MAQTRDDRNEKLRAAVVESLRTASPVEPKPYATIRDDVYKAGIRPYGKLDFRRELDRMLQKMSRAGDIEHLRGPSGWILTDTFRQCERQTPDLGMFS